MENHKTAIRHGVLCVGRFRQLARIRANVDRTKDYEFPKLQDTFNRTTTPRNESTTRPRGAFHGGVRSKEW